MRPRNFSWIQEGELAVSARPGGVAELVTLRSEGIGALVSLTEHPLHPSEVEECGLAYLHLPVEDFTAPALDQVQAFTEFMEDQRQHGHAVLLHCAAGYGRSGTLAACHLVSTEGLDADEALAEVRRLRPGSVETPEQERVIHLWAEHVRSRSADAD